MLHATTCAPQPATNTLLTPTLTPTETTTTTTPIIVGGTTDITFTPAAITALTGEGFSFEPIDPATYAAPTATFPITEGTLNPDGTVMTLIHDGGLELSTSTDTVDFTRLVLDTTNAVVDADVVVDGSPLGSALPLFNILPDLSLTPDATTIETINGALTATPAPLSTTTTPTPIFLGVIPASLTGTIIGTLHTTPLFQV